MASRYSPFASPYGQSDLSCLGNDAQRAWSPPEDATMLTFDLLHPVQGDYAQVFIPQSWHTCTAKLSHFDQQYLGQHAPSPQKITICNQALACCTQPSWTAMAEEALTSRLKKRLIKPCVFQYTKLTSAAHRWEDHREVRWRWMREKDHGWTRRCC